jgi:hypothetical protein
MMVDDCWTPSCDFMSIFWEETLGRSRRICGEKAIDRSPWWRAPTLGFWQHEQLAGQFGMHHVEGLVQPTVPAHVQRRNTQIWENP